MQSKRLPEDAQEIVLDANSSWKVYEDNEAKIDVIDLTEEEGSEEDPDEIPDLSGDEVQDKDEVVEIISNMTTRPKGPDAGDEDLDKIPISACQPFLEEDLPIQEVIVIFSK